tara:strand:- start:1056 stop:1277 length:222 start_codon:yes stop_codon:yes gene_type:complete
MLHSKLLLSFLSLSLGAIQTLPDFRQACIVLPILDLFNHVEGIGEDGQDDVEEEEGADDDEHDAEDDCHPPNV